MKIYLYIGLLLALSAGAWKLYDAIGDAREDKVRLEFAQIEKAKDDEIQRLKLAESELITHINERKAEREVDTNARVRIVRQSVDDCAIRPLPADISSVLDDADRIHTGQAGSVIDSGVRPSGSEM